MNAVGPRDVDVVGAGSDIWWIIRTVYAPDHRDPADLTFVRKILVLSMHISLFTLAMTSVLWARRLHIEITRMVVSSARLVHEPQVVCAKEILGHWQRISAH
ncbi:hypothetical protein RSOLAG1IB_05562 [Rhizoctonia solani AG-1 IB]|uniref:Uncharacterized protein n=1 Tax=Thanatephorus cucumeris (strain AG1-IB / isolate 7/3/14) TaxID=1108050 RepID=A0A0B7G3V6_THACB|nr:hypothetical protein RSOLAG1IB_05562 [Rhizoctonia solani AG-1 IB]